MESQNRRDFLKTGMAAGAGIAIAGNPISSFASSKVLGANDAIRVGCIGLRGIGRKHVRDFRSIPGVQIVALCDVDGEVLAEKHGLLKNDGIETDTYVDMRKMMERKDIDVISIGTPNHWHSLAAVWGCQAGKDVLVEKPVSHNIWEGRKIVEAARKYERMVQADFDSRSRNQYVESVNYMRSAALGKVLYVKSICYKRRKSIGFVNTPQRIPNTIDYDLWCGPVPARPLMRRRLHYDWHWQFATGNAELGNNGPHTLDRIRWMLGKSTLPKTVFSFGGRYGYIDNGDVPNSQIAIYDYDGIPIIFESRALPENPDSDNMDPLQGLSATGKMVVFPHDSPNPNVNQAFFCEKGIFCKGIVYDNDGRKIDEIEAGDSRLPQAHFIDAVRSRKMSDLRTDIEEGHLSTAFCHLGNISYMLGEPKSEEEIIANLNDSEYMLETYRGFKKHLKTHGIDITKELPSVGPLLHFDSEKEQFYGEHSERANMFVKDTYREPFVIPDKV